jgi:hypothetical protein
MCAKFGWNRSRRSGVMPGHTHTHTYTQTSIFIGIEDRWIASLFPRCCPGISFSQSYSHMCTKFGWQLLRSLAVHYPLVGWSTNCYFFALTMCLRGYVWPTVASRDVITIRLPSNSNNFISSTTWIIQIPCLPHHPPCRIYIEHT